MADQRGSRAPIVLRGIPASPRSSVSGTAARRPPTPRAPVATARFLPACAARLILACLRLPRTRLPRFLAPARLARATAARATDPEATDRARIVSGCRLDDRVGAGLAFAADLRARSGAIAHRRTARAAMLARIAGR